MPLTKGTETSKYLQENKSNEIPPVVASERGIAQTAYIYSRRALYVRGCGAFPMLLPKHQRVTKVKVNKAVWKVGP